MCEPPSFLTPPPPPRVFTYSWVGANFSMITGGYPRFPKCANRHQESGTYAIGRGSHIFATFQRTPRVIITQFGSRHTPDQNSIVYLGGSPGQHQPVPRSRGPFELPRPPRRTRLFSSTRCGADYTRTRLLLAVRLVPHHAQTLNIGTGRATVYVVSKPTPTLHRMPYA